MRTFKFYTLGCKVNQYETQLMREQLSQAGLKEVNPHTKTFGVGVNSDTPADLYIINTCTVTADTDRECRRFIRHSIKENPDARIIATGCYVEKDADIIRAIDKKIIIVSNKDKDNIWGQLPFLGKEHEKGSCPHIITHFQDHTKAFIKIQDGCDNFCSFCKVPYVRGAPKSRSAQEIIKEAEGLIKNNYKELVLTGICSGSYGKDLSGKISLKDILTAIARLEGDFRVRLSSIEIQDITDGLIDTIKNSNKICGHLHIPLQSGDDKILKKMNRRYTKNEFIEKIKKINKTIPGIAISTDIIVGFPGEGEEAFKNTLQCIKKIKPMRTHIFSYSKRKGTAAYHLKSDINQAIIKQRYNAIKRITDKFAKDYLICSKTIPQRVLIENARDEKTGKLCGYTDTYVRLTLEGPDTKMGIFAFLPKSKNTLRAY